MRGDRAVRTSIFVMLVTVMTVAHASAQCVTPRYKDGQLMHSSAADVDLTVSIDVGDLTRANLACLAHAIRERYPNRKTITVLVFTSVDAAANYRVSQSDDAPDRNAEKAKRRDYHWVRRQLHAMYSFNADRGDDFIAIKPLGNDEPLPYDTSLPLPLTGTSHCRYEINNRCIVVVDDLRYPLDAYQDGVTGSVTLTGSVGADGKVTHIRVAEEPKVPAAYVRGFVEHATTHLRSWRVERFDRTDAVRVTYSFTIDPVLARGVAKMNLELPGRIELRFGR